uniref:Glutamine amidotransferase type-2 domain-containing protein n=1 Tax=Odontella aurita TaxID=265563 RepID=A0A7S4JCU0_9STRA|mmetsp:Transcript_43928/g.133806  ORF Transcript_43928/g.133806 Transcript_43928/m.133806 type:complete len:829 (+) Transcript_43928:113-2599(+)
MSKMVNKGQNSQHVLAVALSVDHASPNNTEECLGPIRDAFQRGTSELPCCFWSSPGGGILLGANYPHCILNGDVDDGGSESDSSFCILCGGRPYGFRDALLGGPRDGSDLRSGSRDEDSSTLSRCVLQCAESAFRESSHLQFTSDSDARISAPPDGRLVAVRKAVGGFLRGVAGHFSVYICHKATDTLLAYNDTFGFMPLFYSKATDGSCVAFSSYWDCLTRAPNFGPTKLNMDVVAEYLTLGSTLGGNDGTNTFCRNVRNAAPASCLYVSFLERQQNFASRQQHCPVLEQCQYTQCFGACELAISEAENDALEEESNAEGVELIIDADKYPRPPMSNRNFLDRIFQCSQHERDDDHHCIPNVKVEMENTVRDEKYIEAFAGEEGDDDIMRAALLTFRRAVHQALDSDFVTGAALTGGGDTRLILSCLTPEHAQELVFRTHPKQRTDLDIARWISRKMNLRHEKKNTGMSGGEVMLKRLHDEIPQRKRHWRPKDRYKEEVATSVMHGRFGTELLGFLCYVKTSIPVRRAEDLEELDPHASNLFRAMFASTDDAPDEIDSKDEQKLSVCNPVSTLRARIEDLAKDRDVFRKMLQDSKKEHTENTPLLNFDIMYSLQIELYTRAFLCDIYGGLRGGSWFAMPCAYFTRNAISASPFLDARLLRLLMCRLPTEEKMEPYEWYGKLYKCCVANFLRKIPCNNKMLCRRAGMPRAMKKPEASRRIFHPKIPEFGCVAKTNDNMFRKAYNKKYPKSNEVTTHLRSMFNPEFWDGAMVIAQEPDLVREESNLQLRPEVKALVDKVGRKDAAVLSARLQSFLLWFERRFPSQDVPL